MSFDHILGLEVSAAKVKHIAGPHNQEITVKTTLPFTGPDLCRLPAHEVVALLQARKVSPRELLDAAYARIAAVDPAINAMPTLCRDRAEAAATEITPNPANPGDLAGLPIGIKDLTEVKGVRTTYGTLALKDYVPTASEPLVERLEANGGIVVGKTNTPEMGAGGNTFNEVFGRTRNPWDTRKNPAGSSGGAAASLATGEVWLSHGSDHGGSLRTPAAYCGIVGMRPSPGRAGGAAPKTAFAVGGVEGPMARNVRDCALFMDAMSGFDPRSPISFPAPESPFQQAVIAATPKVRIAFSPDLNGFSPVSRDMLANLRQALEKIERNGGTVEETCPDLPDLERTYHTLRGFGMAVGSLIADPNVSRHFKKTLRDNIAFGKSLTAEDVARAELGRATIFNNMQTFLTRYDVLACPTVGIAAQDSEVEYITRIDDHVLSNYMDWLRFAFLATTASLPEISVPVGLDAQGMPVGLQLIGPPRGEAKLLAVARAVEMAVGGPLGPIDPNVTHL